jgi:hypothetical protein
MIVGENKGLCGLCASEGLGGDGTTRARLIRELVGEIRQLRTELL